MKYIYLVICLLSYWFAAGQQQEVQLNNTTAPYGFIEYLPHQYAEKDTLWPLIIFLHGLGEAGNGNNDLSKVKFHGPSKLISNGVEFEAIVLSPQSPVWWDIGDIDIFVEWCFMNYQVDETRFYLTGISMGGGGTWLYAVTYPEKLAAIIPICGAADPNDTHKLANMAVWAFHNVDDPIVNVELTYQWIDGIRNGGGSPKLSLYSSGGHDSWTITYENQEVWDWMFKQRLGVYVPGPLKTQLGMETLVYPNPLSDELSINTFVTSSIMLSDSFGRLVQTWDSVKPVKGRINLNVSSVTLASGIYYLNILTPNNQQIIKLVKQ